jgi:transcriptional regulator with XRE-family HTH domain
MTNTVEPEGRSLAERLDHLFRTFVKRDGKEYSHREVERELKDRFGEQISHAYIGQLRAGRQDNPTIKTVRALAMFFGVPVDYFVSEAVAREVDKELHLAVQLRELRDNPAVGSLVVRARGLSNRSLESLIGIMDRVREIEGLPPPSDRKGDSGS